MEGRMKGKRIRRRRRVEMIDDLRSKRGEFICDLE